MISGFEPRAELEPESPRSIQWPAGFAAGLIAGVILLIAPRGTPLVINDFLLTYHHVTGTTLWCGNAFACGLVSRFSHCHRLWPGDCLRRGSFSEGLGNSSWRSNRLRLVLAKFCRDFGPFSRLAR